MSEDWMLIIFYVYIWWFLVLRISTYLSYYWDSPFLFHIIWADLFFTIALARLSIWALFAPVGSTSISDLQYLHALPYFNTLILLPFISLRSSLRVVSILFSSYLIIAIFSKNSFSIFLDASYPFSRNIYVFKKLLEVFR